MRARSFLSPSEAMAADEALKRTDAGTDSSELATRLTRRIDRLLEAGGQKAIVVCAYYNGVEVAHAGGGMVRHGRTHLPVPVGPGSLFPVMSVSKGIAAAALLASVDAGDLDFEAPARSVWPRFTHGRIRDLASHRACVPLLPFFVAASILSLFVRRLPGGHRGWPLLFSALCYLVATVATRRRRSIGLFATYHQMSFSCLFVRLLEGACGRPFRLVVRQRVLEPLQLHGTDSQGADSEGYLGEVPPAADARIVRMEVPPCGASRLRRGAEAAAAGPADGSLLRWLLLHFVAPLEAWLICALANSQGFRRILLPSSNGYFTARMVARVFGAVANGGVVSVDNGRTTLRLASAAAVADVAGRVCDASRDVRSVHPDTGPRPANHPLPARESSGWFPWASRELHGRHAARRVLNSEGMGGSAAWADPQSRLAVSVLKSTYEPLSALGGSLSPDVIELAAEVRVALGLAEEGDADTLRGRAAGHANADTPQPPPSDEGPGEGPLWLREAQERLQDVPAPVQVGGQSNGARQVRIVSHAADRLADASTQMSGGKVANHRRAP